MTGINWICLVQDRDHWRIVVGRKWTSDSIVCWRHLQWLSNCWLLKKDSAPWSWLNNDVFSSWTVRLRMDGWQRYWKGSGRISHGLIEELPRNLCGGIEEHHETRRDNRSPARDSNRAPPEHQSKAQGHGSSLSVADVKMHVMKWAYFMNINLTSWDIDGRDRETSFLKF
jgi:hypothetical protein